MAEQFVSNSLKSILTRLADANVDVGTEVGPDVSYADLVALMEMDDQMKETRPGSSFEEWWTLVAQGLEFSENGAGCLKEDLRILLEPWMKVGGRRPTPWEKVHPFDIFRVCTKLMEEFGRVHVIAKKIAQGATVLLDSVPHRAATGYPPDLPTLGPLSSVETRPH